MIFRPELAVAIVKGQKTATRRRINVINPKSPWRETPPLRYPEGKEFAIQPGRGADRVADAVVTARAIRLLGEVTTPDAKREGFATLDEFREAWATINGSWRSAERVHVIEFKLVGERCGWCLGDVIQKAGPCPECFGSGKAVSEAARDLIERVKGG